MIKKYKFTLATGKVGSEVSSIQEFEFDDDSTQDEIEGVVNENYMEWVNNKNYGGIQEIE